LIATQADRAVHGGGNSTPGEQPAAAIKQPAATGLTGSHACGAALLLAQDGVQCEASANMGAR
jgi:hypothetical protein